MHLNEEVEESAANLQMLTVLMHAHLVDNPQMTKIAFLEPGSGATGANWDVKEFLEDLQHVTRFLLDASEVP